MTRDKKRIYYVVDMAAYCGENEMPLKVWALTEAEAAELANNGRYEAYTRMSEAQRVINYYAN